MPKHLVDRIDAQTKRQGSSRSDFVRQAVRKQLAALEQWEKLSRHVRRQYKGTALTEQAVADIVRTERGK